MASWALGRCGARRAASAADQGPLVAAEMQAAAVDLSRRRLVWGSIIRCPDSFPASDGRSWLS